MARVEERGIRTTTAEALLGMLSLGAMSGYEIRRTIEGSIGNFWRESYGQIYPTLKRLVGEGLAEVKVERAAGLKDGSSGKVVSGNVGSRKGGGKDGGRKKGGPGRTVYQLTAAGRKRLRVWLKTPSTPQVPRNELLLKIFFAGQGSPGLVSKQAGAALELHRAELERYGQIRARLMRDHAKHPELPYWLMTLEYGVMQSEAAIAWCERTLKVAKRLEEVGDAA